MRSNAACTVVVIVVTRAEKRPPSAAPAVWAHRLKPASAGLGVAVGGSGVSVGTAVGVLVGASVAVGDGPTVGEDVAAGVSDGVAEGVVASSVWRVLICSSSAIDCCSQAVAPSRTRHTSRVSE